MPLPPLIMNLLMRTLFTIFSLFLLVSIQAADACCDHDADSHHHLDNASDGISYQLSAQQHHKHHHGDPCGCVCHHNAPLGKTTGPTPRVEPLPMSEAFTWTCGSEHILPPSTAPPLTENISAPPSSAADICSQHCRFLI